LRNDRNKEISAANEENWHLVSNMGGVAKEILGMMQEFSEIKFIDVQDVDVMKTAFRACPVPLTQQDQVKSDRCREMLKALTVGDDEKHYGAIFKVLANKDNAAENQHIFPYYRALSKQVHWFMVSRKAQNHRDTIKTAKEDIAEKDRMLWKAMLKQQAFEVCKDFEAMAVDIENFEGRKSKEEMPPSE